MEVIDWMEKHTLGDLREMAIRTEQRGGDAAAMRRLLTELQMLQREMTVDSELLHIDYFGAKTQSDDEIRVQSF